MGEVFAGAVGYFGAKAADYFNRTWTYETTKNNLAWREPVKDAAATAMALAVPYGLKMAGVLKGKAVTTATVGGLLYALNRGLQQRAKAKNFPEGSFAYHLLGDGGASGMGDYILSDGEDLFDDDLLGALALMDDDDDDEDDDDDLGDYEYADGGGDDIFDVEIM